MSTDLITRLRAALDAEEHYARQAFADETGETHPEWHEASSGVLEIGADVIVTGDARVSRFMERHDPAFVLADIATKRRVLDEYEQEERLMVRGHRTAFTEGGQSARLGAIMFLAKAYGITTSGENHGG